MEQRDSIRDGRQLVDTGVLYLRCLEHPERLSPEADLINKIATWMSTCEDWREFYLMNEDAGRDQTLIAINGNLIYLSDKLSSLM